MTRQMPLTKFGTRFNKRVEIQSPLKEQRLCQSLSARATTQAPFYRQAGSRPLTLP
jgi:hypothetical protein